MVQVAGIMSMCITTVVAMDNKKNIVDIRKFGLEFKHNKQDERKNTFWHQLARDCVTFEDWSEVEVRKQIFKRNNKNWLPNPLIVNEDGKTAKKEAKAMYNKTGNPVCALLVIHLQQIEFGYLNKMALKVSRDQMAIAQHLEFPEEK